MGSGVLFIVELLFQWSRLFGQIPASVDGSVHGIRGGPTSGRSQEVAALSGVHQLLPDPRRLPLRRDHVSQRREQTKARHLRGQPHLAHRCAHTSL